MSDDGFGIDGGEETFGPGSQHSMMRYPAVTDDLDTVFELLSDAHRRYLFYHLFEMNGGVAEFEAVANAVYRYETAGEDGSDTTRKAVRIGLHHVHLPRLADAGVIDYDRRQGTIRFAGHPGIEEWVEHARYKELD
jgi:hypothetical protein